MPTSKSGIATKPGTAIVIGARKFMFSKAAQNSLRVAWWDITEGGNGREIVPHGLAHVFVRSGLARMDAMKALATRYDAQVVEFHDDKDIFEAISEITNTDANRGHEVSGPAKPETRLAPLFVVEKSKKPKRDLPLEVDYVIDVPVDKIVPNPDQPRKTFKGIERIGKSLLKGQRIPLIIMPVKGEKYDFIICDGERRWRGARSVGKETLRCIVAQSMSEAELYKNSAISNFGRDGHTPMETAVALRRVKESDNLTIEELSEEFSISVPSISQHLALLKLTPEVRKFVDPELPEGQGLAMLAGYEVSKLPAEHQLSAAKHIIERKMNLLQVRHYIAHLIAEVGSTTKQRQRSPQDDYRIFTTFIKNADERAEQLLNLPRGFTIEALFRYRSWEDREAALKALGELSDKLKRITAQIEMAEEKKKSA